MLGGPHGAVERVDGTEERMTAGLPSCLGDVVDHPSLVEAGGVCCGEGGKIGIEVQMLVLYDPGHELYRLEGKSEPKIAIMSVRRTSTSSDSGTEADWAEVEGRESWDPGVGGFVWCVALFCGVKKMRRMSWGCHISDSILMACSRRWASKS